MAAITLVLALTLFASGAASAADAVASQTCASRVAGFVREYAPRHPRLVFTFTGSQTALLPLFEAAGGPHSELAFFPIDRRLFVLTLTYRAIDPQLELAEGWASEICRLGESKGGRYNGALAFLVNDLTGADMSPPPAPAR
ncbi:MAG: hypothetical protein QOE79_917 [Sphingomonadales bacterium]|nr:hypothetical protein [Sphingomonadales bacterium]MEA3049222.1 hypothetical protein [Sphingomonadales bacterium]